MARSRWMNALPQFRHLAHSLSQHCKSAGNPFALPWFDHRCGTERQQSHHGTYLKAGRIAIWEPEHVVVKTILLIPHSTRSCVVHGPSNPQEMLRKFDSKILK